MLFSFDVNAAVVGWYRMEGTPDTAIATVVNSSGTAPNAVKVGTPTINYSSQVVASSILDPVTGIFHANTSSMRMGGGTSTSYLQINDGATAGPLDVADFTIEMFIRIDAVTTDYRPFVSHGTGAPGDGWNVRSVYFSDPDIEHPSGTIQNYNVFANGGPIIDDGRWHHLAFVVQTSDLGGENFARLYMDYNLLHENTGGNLDTYVANVNAHMRIYADRYTGFIDEVRFSNTVLGPKEFLRVIPEPGTLAMIFFGGALLAFRRRQLRGAGSL